MLRLLYLFLLLPLSAQAEEPQKVCAGEFQPTERAFAKKFVDIKYAVDKAHAAKVKVFSMLRGKSKCGGNISVLLQPENRAAVVSNLLDFIRIQWVN